MKEELHPARLMDPKQIKEFIFAGNATVTLVSKASQQHLTFRVRKNLDEDAVVSHFVSLLNGQDNERDFAYLGHFYAQSQSYVHGKKSKISSNTSSAKAFDWFASNVIQSNHIPDTLEIWHEGKCGKCGRKLTVPESIARGIGPECWKAVGG